MTNKKSKTEGHTVCKTLNLHQRINAVMQKASYVKKDDNVSGGAPYKSVSHDTVTKKLRGPLQEFGVVVTTDVVECVQDGTRTQVKLAVTFINMDDPKDRITVHSYGHGVDRQDKGIGKAVSYALKYCLLKTFLLESGTDDDVESHNIDHEPAADVRISQQQIQELDLMINGYDDLRTKILSRCDGDFRNITMKQYPLWIDWVRNSTKEVK